MRITGKHCIYKKWFFRILGMIIATKKGLLKPYISPQLRSSTQHGFNIKIVVPDLIEIYDNDILLCDIYIYIYLGHFSLTAKENFSISKIRNPFPLYLSVLFSGKLFKYIYIYFRYINKNDYL